MCFSFLLLFFVVWSVDKENITSTQNVPSEKFRVSLTCMANALYYKGVVFFVFLSLIKKRALTELFHFRFLLRSAPEGIFCVEKVKTDIPLDTLKVTDKGIQDICYLVRIFNILSLKSSLDDIIY
jgi:hypothetical protein